MIAILYFLTIYGLEMLGSSTICRPWFRGLLADYAYVVCFLVPFVSDSNKFHLGRHNLLGRLCAYSRKLEIHWYFLRPHYSGLLSYAATWLVNPFLGAGGEMGLCGVAIRLSSHAAVLL